ncbi:hypothetical protein PPERSA_13031 [Pseudocohnilembus persalinus]|uniref:Uncharacterized protein n=1 Tax=Pseudocohnilembus persalinus TaxID=266149 RepID=A0A0V0R208_PSEPJ|nr:hypothetical protein PPERSA_13031 [Pseudocohnilembus persalinus]|eukprot:KRX08550.1 hypothetical protein PPERSA_13031 [Pseudocohnilembus persalinus]
MSEVNCGITLQKQQSQYDINQTHKIKASEKQDLREKLNQIKEDMKQFTKQEKIQHLQKTQQNQKQNKNLSQIMNAHKWMQKRKPKQVINKKIEILNSLNNKSIKNKINEQMHQNNNLLLDTGGDQKESTVVLSTYKTILKAQNEIFANKNINIQYRITLEGLQKVLQSQNYNFPTQKLQQIFGEFLSDASIELKMISKMDIFTKQLFIKNLYMNFSDKRLERKFDEKMIQQLNQSYITKDEQIFDKLNETYLKSNENLKQSYDSSLDNSSKYDLQNSDQQSQQDKQNTSHDQIKKLNHLTKLQSNVQELTEEDLEESLQYQKQNINAVPNLGINEQNKDEIIYDDYLKDEDVQYTESSQKKFHKITTDVMHKNKFNLLNFVITYQIIFFKKNNYSLSFEDDEDQNQNIQDLFLTEQVLDNKQTAQQSKLYNEVSLLIQKAQQTGIQQALEKINQSSVNNESTIYQNHNNQTVKNDFSHSKNNSISQILFNIQDQAINENEQSLAQKSKKLQPCKGGSLQAAKFMSFENGYKTNKTVSTRSHTQFKNQILNNNLKQENYSSTPKFLPRINLPKIKNQNKSQNFNQIQDKSFDSFQNLENNQKFGQKIKQKGQSDINNDTIDLNLSNQDIKNENKSISEYADDYQNIRCSRKQILQNEKQRIENISKFMQQHIEQTLQDKKQRKVLQLLQNTSVQDQNLKDQEKLQKQLEFEKIKNKFKIEQKQLVQKQTFESKKIAQSIQTMNQIYSNSSLNQIESQQQRKDSRSIIFPKFNQQQQQQ